MEEKLKDAEEIETTSIEYKERVEKRKPKAWLKTVSAFANGQGGIEMFGIRDCDGKVIGLENIKNDADYVTGQINAKINPLPRYNVSTRKEEGKNILVVRVEHGAKTPYYYESDGRKEAFIRSGNSSIPAPKHILEYLILRGQGTTFDELASRVTINEISFTLLNACLIRETDRQLDKNKDLDSLELITKEGYVTNAGLLLCDQGPLPQSRIFCTRWKGLEKGSINGDAIDDKEYTGSIISLLENAEAFIKNNSKLSWKIEGMKRKEEEEYPAESIREAIVNAIIHRDYQIVGSEIHIDMFDNRLEITSPGGMLDGNCIQDIDVTRIPSQRRNRVISDIFNRLNYMERRGSGLVRILKSYKNCKLKPRFYSDLSSFKVIFPNKQYIGSKEEDYKTSYMMKGNDKDNEVEHFIEKLISRIRKDIKIGTCQQIKSLFSKYGYKYEFKREDIEKLLNIKRTRAGEIINILLDSNMIETKDNSMYKFKM